MVCLVLMHRYGFLDAIASLQLIMSVSQSVSQSHHFIKINKEDIYCLYGNYQKLLAFLTFGITYY